ncbi:hypothetical protein H5410_006004 [Solanum commersonii]|uniref:Uncharacterized protein n=1 Tax=Solanum commersonii TaxID=4109 RepID=A0A9J6A934_SOLCO|nr:hypothetical protein H5410_006004 [Solanum commersonii]
MTSDERTTSDAASELGLLRQSHNVSYLRNLTENGAAVESGSRGHVREDHEPFHDNDAPRSEASDTHEVYGHSHGLIRSTFEDYEWQVLSSQAEDPQDVVTDHEERNLRQSEAPYELVIEHGESEQMSSSEHNETTNNTTKTWRSWRGRLRKPLVSRQFEK